MNVKRMSITLPEELERKIVELRKTEKFCRASYAEIIRMLLVAGLDAVRTEN